MRFRACIDSPTTFHRIIQAIEKLQKKCIIKFTPTEMHIICNSDVNEGGIQVWSQIKVPSIFTSYRIQSNAENVITLSLASGSLLQALGGIVSAMGGATNGISGGGSDDVIMKLAKKNDQAVLTFELTGTTRQGRRKSLNYDVNIEVLKPADVKRLTEPLCPEPDVHILLPPLPNLRPPTDHLKQLSQTLVISASNSGIFEMGVKTVGVGVQVRWENCVVPKMARDEDGDESANISKAAEVDPPSGSETEPESDAEPGAARGKARSKGKGKEKALVDEETVQQEKDKDRNRIYSVTVSIKSFLKFLNSHVVSNATIACICHNHCLILYVYIGDVADAGGVLTFYVPALLDDGGL
ncbi:hypothetical protein JAAARDRAFT_56944 [Jaapia argillacea MUCL 33604]|uniref:Checkpoint protein n=1 Tax=Jaapia argillacea MUCL 33604 TaxID=933084 RepID=A0A067Q8P7_9AGAM|nr:hypothetical protein JAAARDRAFT_56944 [Jaapia argillacea MUCL 33604]